MPTTVTPPPAAAYNSPNAETQDVASQVRTAAGYLLIAGGGRLITRLYESMSDLARRIAAEDAPAAAGALAAARRALIGPRPITGWRRARVRPAPLTAAALDRAEVWVAKNDARSEVRDARGGAPGRPGAPPLASRTSLLAPPTARAPLPPLR